jgi:hypothetical protein
MKRMILTAGLVLALAGSAHAGYMAAAPTPTPIPQPDVLPPIPKPDGLWLIMVPPITTGNEVLTSTPYSQWQEADSYHGYTACVDGLGWFKNNYPMTVLLRNGGSMDLGTIAALMQQAQHAICIAR